MLSCQNAKAEFEMTQDLSASQFPLLLLIVNLKLLAGTLIPMMMRWGRSENEGIYSFLSASQFSLLLLIVTLKLLAGIIPVSHNDDEDIQLS